MTTVKEINPSNYREVSLFLNLPFQLYAHTPQWVPPLETDARRIFHLDKYPFYKRNRAVFFLAFDDQNRVVGRLAILNNLQYNEYQNTRKAFFYMFECENDQRIANKLFETGSEWARNQGLDCIEGPRGFTVFDGKGLLVRGYEHRPAFGLPYNLPYYPSLIEAAGFNPIGELLSGYLDRDMDFPAKFHTIAELLKNRRGLTIARYKTRRDLRTLIPKLKQLYNDSLGGTLDNIPITDDEAQILAKQMIWFANPRLIKIVLKDNQPVGFLFAYPDISAALQRTRGKIWPFGWLVLLLELYKTKWININGAGMVDGYRGLGGTALLFSEMHHSVVDEGYQYADLVQIGTENLKMLRELHDFGIEFYKIHRIYQKHIDA